MHSALKSTPSPGSNSASIDSIASITGIRELSVTAHVNDLLIQGSPHSLNSTSASSLSSSGSLPLHQHHPSGDSILGSVHRSQLSDGGGTPLGHGGRGQGRDHSRNHSANSQSSLTMASRTPSESNLHYPYIPPPPPQMDHTGNMNSKFGSGALQSESLTSTVYSKQGGFPTIRTNTAPLPQSQGSAYLSSPNDNTEAPDSPVGAIPSNWGSPPMRSHTHPVVSTSVSSSGGGLTSPASLSSPVNLNQPSPTSQNQPYPLPSQSRLPEKKQKKEKHTFGGMSSNFLTETLPATGMKLYQGSRKGAKSQGDISSPSSGNQNGKSNKKSGSGGPLSSISTRKQQLSPGGNNYNSSALDRTYSSTGSISSPNTGGASHHYMTSPTIGKNNHSSLDAKVMAREMSHSHSTEDVWQALCIKVLTLFNGQGLTGAIEDLNDLVRRCLQTRNAFVLCDEINELLKNGMLTLNAKLGDVPDEKLVSRLVEVWSFFFGTVLPYFEGVFLPLQIELKSYHARKMTRKGASIGAGSSGGLASFANNGGSSGGLSALSIGISESYSTYNLAGASPKSVVTDTERNRDDSEPENVRTMALTGFRDLVILPMVDRLGDVFAKLFTTVFDASIPVADTAARMLQMTSVLTSIQSGDGNQFLMEKVSNHLKTNWKQFTRRGNRKGIVGLERRATPRAQQVR
ncbi:hypothetical protein BGZ76_010462 [Entomortierella beljakovae]|nr:hypothetical protein BGZ76_010462 [Entomortierella beljakovae]